MVPTIRVLQGALTLYSSLGIFVGFASFFMMEKTLRVLGSEGDGHSHSHSHSHSVEGSASHSSGVELSHSNGELKARKEKKQDKKEQEQEEERSSQNGPSKLSAYLNLFGDFVHNMYAPQFFHKLPLSCGSLERFSTDGLASVCFTPSF
jgi:zinc transporter 7